MASCFLIHHHWTVRAAWLTLHTWDFLSLNSLVWWISSLTALRNWNSPETRSLKNREAHYKVHVRSVGLSVPEHGGCCLWDILTCVSFLQTLLLFLFYTNASMSTRTIAAKTVTCCCSPSAGNFVSFGKETSGSCTFLSITGNLDRLTIHLWPVWFCATFHQWCWK